MTNSVMLPEMRIWAPERRLLVTDATIDPAWDGFVAATEGGNHV